ncbi:Transcriptional regulator [Mesorhizobium sp. J18]|nr:Transcriptional regulator [Mesorhizobium sp. J18]
MILSANSTRYATYGIQPDAIRTLMKDTLRNGYTITHGLTIAGVAAIAVPIRSAGGEVTGALSINMISTRLTSDRTVSLIDKLRREVAHIEAQFMQA